MIADNRVHVVTTRGEVLIHSSDRYNCYSQVMITNPTAPSLRMHDATEVLCDALVVTNLYLSRVRNIMVICEIIAIILFLSATVGFL